MERIQELRRGQTAGTVFSAWVVLGLFLDGWAHNAGKPEDFWTPWHAVLYSGLVAAVLWSVRERRRQRLAGTPTDLDPYIVVGFVLFGLAGVGDAVWHSVFGVEEDVAALLSPTHLALMAGGLLLITGPIRAGRELPPAEASWRRFLPLVVSVALAVAVVAFFLQFVSAFHVLDRGIYTAGGLESLGPTHGVANVLITNALLLGGVAWMLARWPRPPAGAVTFLLGSVALLLSGLHAFEDVALVAAPLLGGAVGDVLLRRGGGRRAVLLAVPSVTWAAWFALHAAVWGLGWDVELWTGTIVLATLTGAGLELLLRAPVPVEGLEGRRARAGEPAGTRPAATPRPAGAEEADAARGRVGVGPTR